MLQYSEDYEKCEGYGEVLKERKRNLEQNRSQLEASIAAQNERISSLAKEEAEFRGKAAALENELQSLRLKLQEEEILLLGTSASASGDAEESLKSELLDILSSMAQLRNEIRYAVQQEESLQRRMERLGDEYAKWKDQHQKVSSQTYRAG